MSSSFLVAALKSPNVKTRPFRMTSWALVCLPIFDMSIIDVFMKMFQQYVTTKPSCEILLMDHHGYMLQLGAIQDLMVATDVLIVLHFASSILLCACIHCVAVRQHPLHLRDLSPAKLSHGEVFSQQRECCTTTQRDCLLHCHVGPAPQMTAIQVNMHIQYAMSSHHRRGHTP